MERVVGVFERAARAGRPSDRHGLDVVRLDVGRARRHQSISPASRRAHHRPPAARTRRGAQALEQRVGERTAALEQANRDLTNEALQRSRSEERHRSLLEQLSHVGRTATVGELASGLAHELNQPLGAIANYVEGSLVALNHESPPLIEVRAALGKALDATLRAGAIVQRVRRFVTRQAPTRESTDPNRLVIEVEGFLRDVFHRSGVAVQLDLAPSLPWIQCDPVQIQQVLVNLARNAIDALSASQPLNPMVIISTRAMDSQAVAFAVQDNGEGIAADRLDRIFDAYFSTRADGMGMGLAICRSIVEVHRGTIHVESTPGLRTTFQFTVPIDGGDGDDRAGFEASAADGPRRR